MSPLPTKTDKERLADANEIIRQKTTALLMAQKEIRKIQQDNDAAEKIRTEIYGLAAQTPSPPKWLNAPRNPKLPGVPMTIWSDWHWGERVDPAQVGGVNNFNRAIACQRVRQLVDSTIDLTYHHMVKPSYPGIVVVLGGDLITGTLHEDLRETNDGPVQVALLQVQEQLIAAITLMADRFGKVFLPCVVGNHGRTTLKPRAKDRVYTSYEWNLYHQLALYFKSDPRVVFHIPDEADAYFSVLGHKFLATHGDALGVKGGDGFIGAIGPIARGTIKVGRSEAQIGRDFDTLLIGHWHTYMPRGDAVPVVVNGSLIGYNEYARLMLRVPYSRPCQALWFIHQHRGFTASWPVYLDEKRKSADTAEWLTWETRK